MQYANHGANRLQEAFAGFPPLSGVEDKAVQAAAKSSYDPSRQ